MNSSPLQRSLPRRSLLQAAAAFSVAGAVGLAGCSAQTLAQTTSLKDKRVKTADSYAEATADEPKVAVKIVATPTFQGVLPALLGQFAIDHANLNFVNPVYLEGGQLLDALATGGYDVVFADVQEPLRQAENEGIIDAGSHLFMWNSLLNIVASATSSITINSGSDLEKQEISALAFCNEQASFSALYARQFLATCGLYSDQSGQEGAFAQSIENKVKVFATVAEMASFLANNPQAVGFLMEPELLLEQQLASVYEVPRLKHRTVSYQGAVLTHSSQMAAGIALLQWCKQDTRAFRSIAAYGFSND